MRNQNALIEKFAQKHALEMTSKRLSCNVNRIVCKLTNQFQNKLISLFSNYFLQQQQKNSWCKFCFYIYTLCWLSNRNFWTNSKLFLTKQYKLFVSNTWQKNLLGHREYFMKTLVKWISQKMLKTFSFVMCLLASSRAGWVISIMAILRIYPSCFS